MSILPGAAQAAPSASARTRALTQLTGLSASQVAARSACPAPAPGQASCDAHVTVVRSTGAPVRLHPHRQHALANVRAAHAAVPVGSFATQTSTAQGAPAIATPAWLQQAYDLTYLSATQGSADTIGIIDAYDDPTAASDLATFRSQYGLPPCTTANGCFQKVNENGQTSPLPTTDQGWGTEESLDLDAVSSLCPNCHIVLVEASSSYLSDLTQAMQTAVNMGADQLSNSWSGSSSTPLSGQYTWPGVATIAATGDDGYLGSSSDAYPAAFPGVTAAGGTTLAAASSGARGYAESAWAYGGSGCDVHEPKPAYQTDSGCTGRAYADVSADADPDTGLQVYDTGQGGWLLVGGTSLSTPLVAAYEAVTGVPGSTPQWAYTDSAWLNDPTSGSTGSCAQAILYICNARGGYDGPTGTGSISGDVATGGPGIGGPTHSSGTSYAQSVSATGAALTGGVYPNGNDTTYWWQYGTTTDYGQQTAATDIGSGSAPVPVSDALSGLSPSTTYHYRLVAENSAGTTYGYDFTLTTPSGAGGSGSGSQSGGSGSGAGSSGSGSSGTSSSGAGATGSSGSTSGSGASGSGSSSSGSQTSSSGSTSSPPVNQPTTPTPAPTVATAPRLTGSARVGAIATLTGGSYHNGSVTSVHFERCARSCVQVSGKGAASYRLVAADAGYYIRAWVTVTGPGGTVGAWAAGTLGPVASRTAGAVSVGAGARTIRGSAGRTLARAISQRRLATIAGGAAEATATADQRSRSAAVRVTRPAGVSGSLNVWACVVRAGAPVSCTAPRALRSTLSFNFVLPAGDRVELIAVARR